MTDRTRAFNAAVAALSDNDVERMVRDPRTPLRVFKRVWPRFERLCVSCRDVAASPAVLSWLADRKSVVARFAAACHPATPSSALGSLADSADDGLLPVLAENPSLPADALKTLLARPLPPPVLRAVLRHPGLPGGEIERLCDVLDGEHLLNLLLNPATPRDAIKRVLFDDGERTSFARSGLTAALADERGGWTLLLDLLQEVPHSRNGYRKGASLRTLAKDAGLSSPIADNPRTSPGILRLLWATGDENVRRKVAANPNTPRSILRRVAERRFGNPDLSYGVGLNPAAPVSVLLRLAAVHPTARPAVAANRNSPPRLLARLLRDENPDVVRKAMANPSTPAEAALEKVMLAGLVDGDIGVDMWIALAGNPNVHPELHECLYRNPNEFVRACFAGNPSARLYDIECLANDPVCLVSTAAFNARPELGRNTPDNLASWMRKFDLPEAIIRHS